MIVKAREINKARTTFIDTILRHSVHSRIHANINQMRGDTGGTVTGRFSYSNPNLQQIPARNKEIGPLIRSIFVPDEGCTWGSFDYSQQEPRVLVHFASLTAEDLKVQMKLLNHTKQKIRTFIKLLLTWLALIDALLRQSILV